MRSRRFYPIIMYIAAALATTGATASSDVAKLDIKPVKDPRALAELKAMGDALSGASSMSFDANSMTPILGPNAQWVHIFATAKVKMQRPDKLFVETGGDAFSQRIYFDGGTFSVSASEHKLYSQTEMRGSVDAMLAKASEKGGESFPFSDVLLSDPLRTWTQDLDGATYIGQSTRGDEKLQHIALTAKNVDWEVWVDEKSHLPRAVFVKYTGEHKSPSVFIEFSKWNLNAQMKTSEFAFKAPSGAKKAELKAPKGGAQ